MNETHDYGEPWRYCIENHPFVVNSRDELVIEKTDENMGDMDIHRAVACVNACAGIPDPAAAIQAAREALAQCELFVGCTPHDAAFFNRIQKALNLLTPSKP